MKLSDLLNQYDYDLREYTTKRNGNTLEHVRWMLDELRDLTGAKAMRWLGFVQGVLWMQGIYTIDQMREHNKGLDEAPEPAPLVPVLLTIVDYLAKFATATRAEARRMIAQRAVKINGEVIDGFHRPLNVGDVIVVGVGRTFTVKAGDDK